MATREPRSEPGAAMSDATRRARMAVLFTLLFALPAAAAWAGPFELIAGWEGDSRSQGYGFVAAGAILPVAPRLSIPVRVTGSHLYYAYDSTGTEVSVRSPGVSLLAGPRWSGQRGSVSLLAGAELRRERRERAGVTDEKNTKGEVVQVDGDVILGPRGHLFALANWSGAADYLYGRASARMQLDNLDWTSALTWFTGLEGVLQGNDNTDAWQAGTFVECALQRRRLSLALHGGYKDSGSPGGRRHRSGYLGAGLYQRF